MKKNSNPVLIGVLTAVAAVIIAVTMSVVLYSRTVDLLSDNLRKRLLAIVTTAAVELDPKDIIALQGEQDYKKPEWARVVKKLEKIRKNNEDIIFVYLFRKTKWNPKKLEFVADSHSINPYANVDGDPTNDVDVDRNGIINEIDQLQWPGQDYPPDPPEEAFLAYNGPITNKDLYEDQYGKVITGYSPIRDSSGNTVAVLGVDIKADDFFSITTQTLYPFLTFVLALIGIIFILTGSLIHIWNKRIELLGELDRQKDELLSMVSHQLAAPVTAIKWYLELLLDGEIGSLSPEQQEQIKTMQSVTLNLSDLVSMILDVSRIQLGRIRVELEDIRIADLMEEIFAIIEPKIIQKSINFTKNIPRHLPQVRLDKRLTRMTIENLLTNAVKYTLLNGKIELTVAAAQDVLKIKIKDSGLGIPFSEQNNVFNKLFRASNVKNLVEGNGFGLYIAKGAVEAQGGRIWFESRENKGTTFYIEYPLLAKDKIKS